MDVEIGQRKGMGRLAAARGGAQRAERIAQLLDGVDLARVGDLGGRGRRGLDRGGRGLGRRRGGRGRGSRRRSGRRERGRQKRDGEKRGDHPLYWYETKMNCTGMSPLSAAAP